MGNLFQNKKILLFTLILIASCLGILGMGGESKAASCGDTFCKTQGRYQGDYFDCKTGIEYCADKNFGDCITKCLKNSASKWNACCIKGGNSSNHECYEPLVLEINCDNDCCKAAMGKDYECKNGKCQISSKTCTDVCVGKGYSKGFCSATEYSGTYTCLGSDKCGYNYNSLSLGEIKCTYDDTKPYCVCYNEDSCFSCGSLNKCTANGCEKATVKCDCRYGNWQDSGKCGSDGGCSNDNQMFQTRTKNPTTECGVNDCKKTTQCIAHSNCSGTIPDPIVPVIPQSSSTSGGGSSAANSQDKYTGGGGAVRFENPLSTNSFEALVMGIINWILGIVVSLAILFLIIGGLMYIVSAGDEERIKKAKNIILYAIVGLGVVVLSWSIITELKDILGVQ